MKTSNGSKKEVTVERARGGAPEASSPANDGGKPAGGRSSGTRLRAEPNGAPCAGFVDAYRQCKDYVLRKIEARGLESHAPDVSQNVFWRLRRRYPAGPVPNPMAVLPGIVDDEIRNQRRSEVRRRIQGEPDEDTPASSESNPEQRYSRAEEAAQARELFKAIFAELDPAARDVLTLVEIDDLSRQEAATALGCSTGTLDVRLHRARRKFAETAHRLTAVPPTQRRKR
jgi:RNA polymerase sigma-70 factor (ECF subfamily)